MVQANYFTISAGPDRSFHVYDAQGRDRGDPLFCLADTKYHDILLDGHITPYDPTNGTVSIGNIYRIGQ